MKIAKESVYACEGVIPSESSITDRSMEVDVNSSKDEDCPVHVDEAY
jgi:hypothetical protein